MLALIQKSDNSFVKEVIDNSSFSIGNDLTSPAYVDWENDTYILKTIVEADPIPAGYVGNSLSVIVTDGVPKYVWNTEVRVVTPAEVNTERDRRIATQFVHIGKSYSMDSESKSRIIGAATLAGFAIANGAQVNDFRWHGGSADFVWIADDNSLNAMDAQGCFLFGQAAAAWESSCIFAARAIKETSPIPTDYTADSYWPEPGN